MRRRTVLTGSALLLAGCLDSPGDAPGDDTEDDTPATTTTTTSAPTTERTTTGRTTRATSRRPTDDTKRERFVVQNRTTSEATVRAAVLGGGERLVGGWFAVPADTELRFDRRFEWGRYTVRGRLPDGEWVSEGWTPGNCASTPNPNGPMNAGVVVTDDGVEVLFDTCDYFQLSAGGDYYVENAAPASEHHADAP